MRGAALFDRGGRLPSQVMFDGESWEGCERQNQHDVTSFELRYTGAERPRSL